MLRKALIAVFLIVLGGLFVGGCAKTTCEKICDYTEDCLGYACDVDDCIDDYKDEDMACRTAIRKFARCVDKNSCSEVDDGECSSEGNDVMDECGYE